MKSYKFTINGQRIRTSLFGLNKVDASRAIKNAQGKELKKVEQIEEEINQLRKEKQKFSEQMDKLKSEIQIEKESSDFIDYCLKRSDCYIELFKIEANKEIAEVDAIGQKLEKLLDEKINEFDLSIKETQIYLERLLDDIKSKNKNIEEGLARFMEDEGSYKFLTKIEPENLINEEPIFITKEIHDSAEVIMNNVEALLGEVNSIPFDINTQLKNNVEIEEIKITDSGFWDGIENEGESEDPINYDNENDLMSKDLQVQIKTESQVMKREISNIRNKYLIGKIVGADIKSNDGEIIIQKNQEITDEVVDKVDQLGKLPELIVNMTLPEIAM